MLRISHTLCLADDEIELKAIRAQGAGGQNVNKLATAIHLRFDIPASSLPEHFKHRLLQLQDQRINKQGVLTIKAQRYRSQEKNRQEALDRLAAVIRSVAVPRKPRLATRVPKAAKQQRLEAKTRRGQLKRQRRPVSKD